MAAVSSAHAATTALTPPSSSHGDENTWGYSHANAEDTLHDKSPPTHFEQTATSNFPQNGNPIASSFNNHSSFEMTARRMHSADNLSSARWNKSTESGALSPALAIEPKMGRASPADWSAHSATNPGNWEDQKRPVHQALGLDLTEENSKWIHRDKLAKIESAELQAAGIYIPRSRAPSKQRGERSNSRMRREQDQPQDRPRKDSATLDQQTLDAPAPVWDLRTPEEIAEEEANAYFMSGSLGGSRIPVAKTSPAPIPLDYLERGSPALRRQGESFENDPLSYQKTRSRSASAVTRDADSGGFATLRGGKRSMTDMSPRKQGARKTSSASKTGTPTRPKTRSGTKDSPGARPSTRSGETQRVPEGDPPWMVNAYKPDPRLPPDQQLLPTVARRLQQEKWEKEGKFGDVYDTEFRPLNDHAYLKPPEAERGGAEDEENQQGAPEWPLKAGSVKSPTLRQGSYSTMPKISDKPQGSPIPSPRTPASAQMPHQLQQEQQQHHHQDPEALEIEEAEKKGGCGCCVVM